jgi:hypothetical protein
VAAGEIDHPILLQRVELEFDPNVPEMRLVDADRAPELYGSVIHDGEGVSADTFHQLRAELEAGGFHPLAGEATSAGCVPKSVEKECGASSGVIAPRIGFHRSPYSHDLEVT